jgi:DNA transposition AAA+ family ATPase
MTAHTQARTFNYQAIEDAWTKGKIAVLDSMPGSGKTTAITDYLRDK